MFVRAIALLVSVILAGLGFGAEPEVASLPQMTAADLAECRKLGGKAVYVEYRRDSASTRTIVQGVPRAGDGPAAGMEVQIETRATKKAMRANGWDEAAVYDLVSLSPDNEFAREQGDEATDAELEARRQAVRDKLEKMASCLDEARGGAPGGG